MNRTHLWLGVALLAQLALLVVLRAPFAGERDGAARPLLPQLEGLEARRIELVDEDGDRLEITRTDGGWTLPAAEGFPADGDKIATLLDDLGALEVRRPLVRSARYHDTFRVAEDDFIGRLTIWGDGADPAVDLLLGSASNYRTTHARLADEDAVYELEGLAPFDLSPRREAWVRKELVDLAPDDVVGLRLDNRAGELTLALGEAGWTIAGDPGTDDGLELDPGAVDSLIRAAAIVRIVDAAGAIDPEAHGLARPTAEIELRRRGGELVRLLIGDTVADDQGKRYATTDGLEFAVTVRESSLQALLGASRDTLLRPVAASDE